MDDAGRFLDEWAGLALDFEWRPSNIFGPDGLAGFCAGEASQAPVSAMPESNGEIARSTLLEWLAGEGNDLERPAIARLPLIGDVLAALRAQHGCELARMSGSGSACFAIFPSQRSADAAARALAVRERWWVEATCLGG